MSRTINHSGSTAPYNFTVVAPDEYTYIFSPNFLQITLGAGYSATQEVSISCNSITLKRNCIDRVCNFDLSAIFESYFADADFSIDYDNIVNDPFFYGGVHVVVTANTGEAETIDFDLRWGAYQFDEAEPETWVDVNMPFWVGMPLVFNTFITYDKITIDGTEYSTPTKSYPIEKTADFNLVSAINAGGSPPVYQIQESVKFKVNDCPTDGYYFMFVDSHGQIRHYMFNPSKTNLLSTEVKTTGELMLYPLSLDSTINGRTKQISKSKQRKFACYAEVDKDIFEIVQSIGSSPIVRLYSNEKWIDVKISDMTIRQTTAWTQDLEIEVQLPEDYIQTR